MIKHKIIQYIDLYKFYKINIFFEKMLQLFIFIFIFAIPFDPSFGKTIGRYMIYFWILSFQAKYIVIHLRNSKLFMIITIFMMYMYSSYIWSDIPLYNSDYINTTFKYLFIPFIILLTSIKQKYIKYYISIFLFAMFINELVSYSLFFGLIQNSIFGLHLTGTSYDPVPFQSSHMEYSVYVSFTIFLLLFIINIKQLNFKLVLYILFSITMLSNLFLSAGRSGQFTFLSVSILLIFIYFIKKPKYFLLSSILLSLSFIIAYTTSNTFHERIDIAKSGIYKVLNNNDYSASFGVRLSSYVLLPEIIKIVPPLHGVGMNDTDSVIHNLQINHFSKFNTFLRQQGHLHNTYITIYVGLGIIGVFFLLYIFYLIFKLEITDPYLNYIKYVFLFTIFFAGFTENMFRQQEIMFLFATFLSFLIKESYLKKQKVFPI